MTAVTLTALAHAGVCVLLCSTGLVSSGPVAQENVVRVAVLNDTPHNIAHSAPPKLALARPVALHVTAPVLPVYDPPQAVVHAAGAGSITLHQVKPRPGKAMQSYPAEVSLALARVKHYPLSERMARHQGRVWLLLNIAADGNLIRVSLQQSCGIGALDRAAISMAQHAGPFPAVPTGRAITLAVPVSFFLES